MLPGKSKHVKKMPLRIWKVNDERRKEFVGSALNLLPCPLSPSTLNPPKLSEPAETERKRASLSVSSDQNVGVLGLHLLY